MGKFDKGEDWGLRESIICSQLANTAGAHKRHFKVNSCKVTSK